MVVPGVVHMVESVFLSYVCVDGGGASGGGGACGGEHATVLLCGCCLESPAAGTVQSLGARPDPAREGSLGGWGDLRTSQGCALRAMIVT